MRISDVKNLSDNICFKRTVSYLWDNIEEYRNAMEHYSKDNCSADDIYSLLIGVYLNLLDTKSNISHNKDLIGTYEIKELSKTMHGDSYYWAIGTKWEYKRIRYQEICKDRKERPERYNSIVKLYDRLSIKDIGKQDILKMISKDKILYDSVLESIETIHNREDLFNVCENIIVPRFKSGEWKVLDFRIMGMVSYLTYGSCDYWAQKNGIDSRLIKSRIFHSKYNEITPD